MSQIQTENREPVSQFSKELDVMMKEGNVSQQ